MLQWRLEALRTGESFAAVAQRRSLRYRVEQVFLVHRATSHWLLHAAADDAIAQDTETVAALLKQIQELGRDFFVTDDETQVEEFTVGKMQVWIARGPHALIAAAVRGTPPSGFRGILEEAIARIHARHGEALTNFSGDTTPFEAAAPDVTACLRTEYDPIPEAPRLTKLRVPVAAVAIVLLLAAAWSLRKQRQWRDFVARLKAEPGILVAAAERNWFAPSRVAGLRDARSRDPAVVAREAKLNPARIRFEWKEYEAADPALVRRRAGADAPPIVGVNATLRPRASDASESSEALAQFTATFTPPQSVAATIRNGALVLSGTASYEWIERVREGATKISGITAINGDDLVVEFDPELVLQRFREQFGMPESIRASLRNGRLLLTGEAPHEWLDRVRRGAMHIPGIHLLDDRRVVDIDQRTFTEAKAALDEPTVLFGLSRDSVRPDATPVLERVAEDARRCFGAAGKLGVNVRLEVRGYGDAIAAEAENAELSRRRAEAVRSVLIASGVEGEKLESLGLGAPPKPEAGEKPGAGKFDRRVFFRVVIQP